MDPTVYPSISYRKKLVNTSTFPSYRYLNANRSAHEQSEQPNGGADRHGGVSDIVKHHIPNQSVDLGNRGRAQHL